MVRLWIEIDEQYPAYYVMSREDVTMREETPAPPTAPLPEEYYTERLSRFEEEAVEFTDEEAALVREFQDVRRRYEIMCKAVLERNKR